MPQFTDGRERSIRVWTPENYDKNDTETKYPVVYMHDAQNLFDAATSYAGEWKVDETITDLMEKGVIPEGAIVVGIDNFEHRMSEYTPNWGSTKNAEGDLYGQFIVETLKPYIDANYNTLTDKDNTMIAGSSMGGLISFAIGLQYPEVFGMVGAFSSSFQIPTAEDRKAFIESIDYTKDLPRLYMDAGKLETLYTYISPVSNELYNAGYPQDKIYTVIDETGTHSETSWSKRFPDAITWLFGEENGNFTPAEATLTTTLNLSTEAADYLDELAVDGAQMILYTGSLSSSPVFEKVDRTTYKATMVVDENAVISYSVLFYKPGVIEIYGLDADQNTIDSQITCAGLETSLTIDVSNFTQVAKLDLDIKLPAGTEEYFNSLNDDSAELILYTGALANSYYPTKVDSTTYNLTTYVEPGTRIKFQTLYYGKNGTQIFETNADGTDLADWNYITVDSAGLVEKTYEVKGWQVYANVTIEVTIPEIVVNEGETIKVQLYGGSFGGSWSNAQILEHKEGNTYYTTVKLPTGVVSFTVGYIVFAEGETTPYDQYFDTNGKQYYEAYVPFDDFDPENLSNFTFTYDGASF